jgi:RHS repeat-associated protein
VTDDTAAVKSRLDYFPFGEQLDTNRSDRGAVKDGGATTYNAAEGMRQKFTGKERDEETGVDYFKARNYQACLARFGSVDPRNRGADSRLPQSWNAYAYVLNSPMILIDIDGEQSECSWTETETGGTLTCQPSPTGALPVRPPPIPTPIPGGCNDPQHRQIHAKDCNACWEFPEAHGCANSSPNDPGSLQWQILQTAVQVALEMLKNPECASLFGEGVDSGQILESVFSPTWSVYGNVQIYDGHPWPAPPGTAAWVQPLGPVFPVGPPVPLLGASLGTVVHVNGEWLTSTANYPGGYKDIAISLLHELGHVFDFHILLPGSQINTLADILTAPFGGSGSIANQALVRERCRLSTP